MANGPKVYRGSRKHVLDWTGRPEFLSELAVLAAPAPISGLESAMFMPQGSAKPREARLETFGPAWLPGHPAWQTIEAWWLKHTEGANTPNWDIAVGCQVEERPGLVLVEAKANWPELSAAGKGAANETSSKSVENHEQIDRAINEANNGWQKIDDRTSISRSSHYQLANRLAFTWKLSQLGLPVVLIYLGFTGDEGIRDAGKPFSDHGDWQKAFKGYSKRALPETLLETRIDTGRAPVWVFSRSRVVMEQSPAPRSL